MAWLTFFNINAFSLEQLSQLEDLFFELAYELSIGILIDHSLTDNLFSAISVSAKREKKI